MTALKSGVKLKALTPQAVVALLVASSIAESMNLDLVVTSANDSSHMAGSKHYSGEALDFRTHDWTDAHKQQFMRLATANLGADFDVILEALGLPNEHLHVEYDAKDKP